METQKTKGYAEKRAASKICKGRCSHLRVNDEAPANVEAIRVLQQQSPGCSEENNQSEIEKDYSGTRVDVPRKHARQVVFSLRKSHPEDHCKGTVTLVPL